ncbi:hypothetical protein SLE2022_144220 [Rubroshorea leprosula]
MIVVLTCTLGICFVLGCDLGLYIYMYLVTIRTGFLCQLNGSVSCLLIFVVHQQSCSVLFSGNLLSTFPAVPSVPDERAWLESRVVLHCLSTCVGGARKLSSVLTKSYMS